MTTDIAATDNAIIHSDLSGLCHWASAAFLQRVGLELEQLRGQFWLKIVHPDDRTRIMNIWDDAMARRAVCALSFRVQLPNGSIETLHLKAQPIHTSGHGGEFCVGWLTTPAIEEREQSSEAVHQKVEALTRELRTHAEVERALREEVEKLRHQAQLAEESKGARIEELESALQAATTQSEAHAKKLNELEGLQRRINELQSALTKFEANEAAAKDSARVQIERLQEEHAREVASLKSANESLQRLLTAREQSASMAAESAAQLAALRAAEATLHAEKHELQSRLDAAVRESVGATEKLSSLTDANQRLRNELQGLYHSQADLGRRLEQQEREFQSLLDVEKKTLQQKATEITASQLSRIAALEKELLATQELVKTQHSADSSPAENPTMATQLRGLLEFEGAQLGLQVQTEIRCLDAHAFMHPDEVKHLTVELLRQLAARGALVDQTDISIVLGRQSMICRVGPCIMGSVELESLAMHRELKSRGGRLHIDQLGVHEWFELHIGPESNCVDGQPLTQEPNVTHAVAPSSSSEPPSIPTHVETIEDDQSPRVLVAEDNLINQKVIGRLLQELGCRVDFAANGREVFEQLQRDRYDLIFMDCQMPVVDGYEATKGVRAMERNKPSRTPIAAMSAHVDIDNETRCRDGGMDFYLTKPVQRSRVEQILSSIGLAKAA